MTNQTITPENHTFRLNTNDGNKRILTFQPDGKIILHDDADPTEAAKQCLDALSGMIQDMIRSAVENTRATPAQAEPVAWMYERNGKIRIGTERSEDMLPAWEETPLYLHPPAPDMHEVVEALKVLVSNVEYAFPALKHLGPVKNARAALTKLGEA